MMMPPWISTFTGKRWHFDRPNPADVDIRDIAHALAYTSRYGGHCDVSSKANGLPMRFYSVAEHCVLMTRYARVAYHGSPYLDADLFACLHHDSGEAYVGDVPAPLKHMPELYAAWAPIERRTELAVWEALGIEEFPQWIKGLDQSIRVDEMDQLFPPDPGRDFGGAKRLGVTLSGWAPESAEREFLWEHETLSRALREAA